MRICVYTIITNNYDTVKPITVSNIPHYLFTDNPNIEAKGYNIIPIESSEDCRLQRKIKILGHPELDKYDVTIYIDASMTLRATVLQLLRTYRGGFIIGNHKRNCVYAEGLAVKQLKKAPEDIVNKQISEYYEHNYPTGAGMWSSGFMIRDKSTKAMCELWYSKLEEHSHRDQLSLPWALWKTGTKPQAVRYEQFVSMTPHKKKEPIKVFYSSPFRTDKNIGLANNEFISLLPDDSWICITDADAMFLRPDYGKCIEEIIQAHGNDFGLIGCTTNRLGGLHQLYENKFSEDFDIMSHYKIANKIWADNGSKVSTATGVAGVCMIFSKKTWLKAGKFKEKSITADTEFNKAVVRSGGKIGLANGLYMFHAYRLHEAGNGQKKAQQSIAHLI